MTTRNGPQFLWHFSFKTADVLFKLISWLLIIVGLRVAYRVTGNDYILYVSRPAGWFYSATLFFLAVHLMTRRPASVGVLDGWAIPLKIFDVVLGVALLLTVTSLRFPLDQLVDQLVSAKFK